MLSKGQFGELHKQLMASPGVEGGFSVNAVTGEPPSPEGSMVSYLGETMHSPADVTRPSNLANYVRTNREALSQPGTFFGGWKPETDEFTTLDRSQQVLPKPSVVAEHGEDVAEVDALTSALDLGIARDQYSVHNYKRGRSIFTKADRGQP